MIQSFSTHLSCWACGRRKEMGHLVNLCDCGKPLRVEYDLEAAKRALHRDDLAAREWSIWRYPELMPAPSRADVVTLGEGGTPLLSAPRLAAETGVAELYIKDEAVNPTGSFKARGMSAAVTMARVFGVTRLAVPSAGNAGGALAAYAARAGLEAHIFMPRDVPAANRLECELAGAHVTLVDGLINDCGRIVSERKAAEGWFDVSTLKEPYRVEGKKTLGYEIAEQLGWTLPDCLIYPTGGGTGLIGMGKAFEELEQLGWIDGRRPRFVSVQATGCAPIVRAFESGADSSDPASDAHTLAAGLRVPRAIADFVILRYLRESNGTAIAVNDEEMLAGARRLSAATGVCACPEGGACLAALERLRGNGWIGANERVVIFNTGSGLKYAEAFSN